MNQGIQIRNVTCLYNNGTIADDEICQQKAERPITKQNCFHLNCTPIWIKDNEDDWSQVGSIEPKSLLIISLFVCLFLVPW